jgi:HAD superfamily hydrolase (TIGR01484 family)
MRPLSQFTDAKHLHGLLFDLDDTLLSHGTLTREAYDALWSLHDAKLGLVAVTGRPSGWGEILVRQWPILGAVTENGAILCAKDGVHDPVSASERQARRVRLASIIERVREKIPEARLADDVGARRSDVTWDIGERIHLPADRVQAMRAIIEEAGANTFVSSVHLHATFDAADKASGAVRALRELANEDATSALSRWAFVGDSGNDRACFAAFRTTFGVANVRGHMDSLSVPPQWVATLPMGQGFAEISRAILAARMRA